MKEKVLEMLRSEGDFLSGETISARLGVSRAAVWKVMQKLKEEGYAIESVPNRLSALGGHGPAVPFGNSGQPAQIPSLAGFDSVSGGY